MYSYEVLTPHGIFTVLQRLTYGEMLLSILVLVLIAITGLKLVWQVGTREGWF